MSAESPAHAATGGAEAAAHHEALPHPEDHDSAEAYLAALDGARELLFRMVFPLRDAQRLWRALRDPFTGEDPVVTRAGWQADVLSREIQILAQEVGDDPTRMLEEAVRIEREAWAEAALARGAEALAPFRGDKGQTLLGKAIQLGRVQVVERVLDAGVHPDAELPLGWTPLALAVFHGQDAVVRLLTDRGAGLAATIEGGHNAYRIAAELGALGTLGLLEERGVTAARDPTSRVEALLAAAQHGHLDVLRHLLDDGVPLDSEARQALYRSAVSGDRTEVVEELALRGFDPLERSERHLLRHAAAEGLTVTLRHLLHRATLHGIERARVEEALGEADLWLHERPSPRRKEAVRLLREWLERNPAPRSRDEDAR